MKLTDKEKQTIIEKRIEVLNKLKTLTSERITEHSEYNISSIIDETGKQLDSTPYCNTTRYEIILKNDNSVCIIREDNIENPRYLLVGEMRVLIVDSKNATWKEYEALDEIYKHCEKEIKDLKYNAVMADLDYILESI